MKKLSPLFGFLLFLWCRAALALSSPQPFLLDDYRDPALDRGVPFWQSILAFGFKLLFVLGLVVLTLWFLRRFWVRNSLTNGPAGNRIRVLESVPLVGTQSLHLVSVRDRVLVIASNGQGMVEKLLELPEEEVSFKELAQMAEHREGADHSENRDFFDAALRQVVIPGSEE